MSNSFSSRIQLHFEFQCQFDVIPSQFQLRSIEIRFALWATLTFRFASLIIHFGWSFICMNIFSFKLNETSIAIWIRDWCKCKYNFNFKNMWKHSVIGPPPGLEDPDNVTVHERTLHRGEPQYKGDGVANLTDKEPHITNNTVDQWTPQGVAQGSSPSVVAVVGIALFSA